MAAAGYLKTDQNTILCYHMKKSFRDKIIVIKKRRKIVLFVSIMREICFRTEQFKDDATKDKAMNFSN